MSPEQAAGRPVDARSDIFSFGVVLYEMLEGKRPFTGNTDLQLLQAIQSAPINPLSNKDVPRPLRLAIEKALEKDPAGRYQSMRDFVVDLKRFARRSDPGLLTSAETARVNRRWIAVAITLIVFIVVAAGAGWLWLRSRSGAPLPRLEYTQLTNFADSAVAPTLSPDGRMLAFIRGESTFEGPGEVYVKRLPGGSPVQLSHDGLKKEGPLTFSPDGSHIAYTMADGGGETWTVPVTGGEPSLLLPRSTALSWVGPPPGERHVMFSWLTGEGNIHMAVYESTESRSNLRAIYIPPNVTGMAHRSFLSPDGKNVLIVEMDLGSWLPCRAVPFDGSSPGFRVGPQPAQCTDAAWSPDGKWVYVSANTGDGFHIWRRRFPAGTPEQVTSGATEEQGLSFAPDGRSFVTSVGTSESTLWVHDAHGNHQITSEGFAFLPSFSSDGRTLYYLVRSHMSRRFVSGELWAAHLETGHVSRLLPDFVMEQYNVSPDGKRVVFQGIDDSGRSVVWLAPLDGSTPPRRVASQEYVARAIFDPKGGILFVGGEEGVTFLYHVNEDGSGLQKLIPSQVAYLYAISPEGHSIATWVGTDIYVYSHDGKSQTLICRYCGTAGEEKRGITPPLLTWSRNERFLYVHSTATQDTYAVPLPPGRLLPSLPPDGLSKLSEAAKLPGARVLPEHRSFGGADPSIYAYPIVTTHRNIYRIPVPQ
jgi:Tol biopolymer transport system component